MIPAMESLDLSLVTETAMTRTRRMMDHFPSDLVEGKMKEILAVEVLAFSKKIVHSHKIL